MEGKTINTESCSAAFDFSPLRFLAASGTRFKNGGDITPPRSPVVR